ncbi:hypothetical protein LVJ94_21310 [Pendulispora rubella]|uniref:Cytochrome c domain-containing protein n=1 Tax=Pendulispora rubella TaxID=2741070 RepID=A0ABZ2LG74_9BACT
MSLWRKVAVASVAMVAACARMPEDAPAQVSELRPAGCAAQGPTGAPSGNHDAVAALLGASPECPANVLEFRARLEREPATLATAFVDNRGFHNGAAGSFSLFESVTGVVAGVTVAPGDFFFGHFTEKRGTELVLEQTPEDKALLIELIAWDPAKGLFNFYELRGDGTRGQWFYRGDSADILRDIARLHRQDDPAHPVFGQRLRCSGCHLGGGPIMKELDAPHNDWWTSARPLPLAGLTPEPSLSRILGQGLGDAEGLAARVRQGSARLESSVAFRAARRARTRQERLRPLFCPEEMNLASDATSNEARAAQVKPPSAFFVDPRLASRELAVPRAAYDAALRALKSAFPESGQPDGDHPWLAPVKAAADAAAVDALVREHVVDEEFVADVLAVDVGNPALSPARCALLRLVPEDAQGGDAAFVRALAASKEPAAHELHANLTEPARDAAWHRAQAAAMLEACARRLQSGDVTPYVELLAQRRAEVFANEISKNPRGQILEPGFRVIFPDVTPDPRPGARVLTRECTVVRR